MTPLNCKPLTRESATLALLVLALPMLAAEPPPPQPQPSTHLWKWSLAAVALAHTADIASSWGALEANPLLRGPDGRIAMRRAVAVKGGTLAGAWIVQRAVIRKWPRSKAARVFAGVNFGVAVGTGAVAVRNWRIR